ncbi:hypothetical protein TIFTF001_036697 [Ficus carica]|uniref:Uncharacterized protein n=1 Tax=Ficus carica TaxID=3494 RepID=A0AA88E4W9_FICCA|nr:hypothetical protein TIFTF001_036697 [Ficus carica]
MGLFLISWELRCGDVVDDRVHPSFDLIGAKHLLVVIDTGLVEAFHKDRD